MEIVRRAAALYTSDLAAFLADYPPEIEWILTDPAGEPQQSIKGIDAVREMLEDWQSMFSDYELGVDRVIDAGDRVVLLCWQRGRGDQSATPVAMKFAQVLTVRDGKIVLTVNYTNRDKALEAAGLSSE